MAETKKRKTSAAAKSGSRAKTAKTAARKPAQKKTAAKRTKTMSCELKGIILIAAGLFLALSFFTNAAGIVGNFLKNVFMGLFGGAANIFFVYIIWMGINVFLEKKNKQQGFKPVVLFGLMIFSSVFAALCTEEVQWFKRSFVEEIRNMFELGTAGYAGGVIGTSLCRILYKFLGWGTWIVTMATLIILLVLLTETSLEKLWKRLSEAFGEQRRQLKEAVSREISVDDENDEEYSADDGEEIAEIKVKKSRKKQAFGQTAETSAANLPNDYFDLYFSGEDIESIPSVNLHGGNALARKENYDKSAEEKTAENTGRFSFSDEELDKLYTSDITIETEESAEENDEVSDNPVSENETENPYKNFDETAEDGILTTLPDENGKYRTKGQEEEFEPPSLTQIKEAVDPNTRAAIESGVPLDEAVSMGKKITRGEAQEAAGRIGAMAEESIEATKLLNYKLPPISLLSKPKPKTKSRAEVKKELEDKANRLLETLLSFKVEAKILNITQGPTVTRFELQPGFGVKVSKITHLADDIALSLAASGVRIEAPIPGKSAIGIEIPNEKPSPVPIREVIDTEQFKDFKSKTAFALGKDISGNCIIADIAQFPHILIAGATGSGKSVCINSLIASILYKAKPDEVKLIMVDPKMVELGVYNGIPHLLIPVVTDPKHAAGALNWAVCEMKNRYQLLKDNKVRNIQGFNALMEENETPELKLPEIVIIIDELADLMLAAKSEVEDAINSLAALARAAGMYLVIATQRPSVDVITGVIKANVPSRISFAVSSQIDSRTILDSPGAEKLLGKGDMLYAPRGAAKPMRIQGNFLSDAEIENIIDFIKNQYEASYDESVLEHIEREQEAKSRDTDDDEPRNSEGARDELFYKAVEMFLDEGRGSAAMLQRKFKIGYQRAVRLIDQLEEANVLGPYEGSKARQILISRQEFNEMMMNVKE